MLETLFWISAFLFILNYFIYPFIIISYASKKKDKHKSMAIDESYVPTVSFIIAAYNEEKVITAKIENTLNLAYKKENLEIIIVSDGSDDATHDIASNYKDKGIIALHEAARNGKSAALNRGVEKATGEIIVFSDANNDFDIDAIQHLIKHFSDDQIGAVTGSKHVYDISDLESTKGDGLYWKYESAIKQAESTLGSITSGDGEIFAIRKSLYEPIAKHVINDDAALTFSVVKQGYRVIYESQASSYENASKDLIDDYYVKVRMSAGGYQTISNESKFLFPPKGWFEWTFFLHKILRWLAPVFLILILISSVLLRENDFYSFILYMQIVFYGVSLMGWFLRKSFSLPTLIYIPMYFSLMNLALFMGLMRFLKGSQQVQWRKAER